jgi:hypothetical protein
MPEPILVAIAAALASKGATSLYDFVKRKFGGNEEAVETLEAAEGASADSAEVAVLGELLATAERDDAEFGAELRARWAELSVSQRVAGDGVANQISSEISGQAVQARDIEGGVTFGR